MTNLTDRIAQLRDQKSRSAVLGGPEKKSPPPPPAETSRKLPERRMASDSFMLFSYTLLGVAITCQFLLIVWLDLV
ncbi:hypothetical protein [Coraliomargarita parva]|uniref:hypothetical protein n=1 Tax=Coraliomargarita parva TaxID=3014050 RepID=UPI0022B44550|nr:hypothetical protein [Coraliomargarita parva]